MKLGNVGLSTNRSFPGEISLGCHILIKFLKMAWSEYAGCKSILHISEVSIAVRRRVVCSVTYPKTEFSLVLLLLVCIFPVQVEYSV